jgi:hypothetical protein
MDFSTPYLLYIVEAYGISLLGLFLFFCISFGQWRGGKKGGF